MFELPQDILSNLNKLSKIDSKDRRSKSYFRLSENYRDQNYLELDLSQAVAYAQARMPATYNVIRYVLDKFMNKCEIFSEVLDVGAGVGALKIALRDYKVNYEALEKSEAMRKVFRKLNDNKTKIYAETFQKFRSEKQYQTIFVSYFINEIEDKNMVLEKIFELAKQYVFILEPGTPIGYKNILQAKKFANQLGWHVLLPCASIDCNLSNSDWCHFSVRVPRTKLHMSLKKAVLPYEDEKFCYVIFSKKETEFSNNKTIIKRPIKKSGHVIFDVCTINGVQRIVKTDKISKKLHWGDQL